MAEPSTASGAESPRRRALRRGLRGAETCLAVLGAACLGVYAVACAQAAHTQATEREAFERALRARLERDAPDRADWSARRIDRYEASLARPVRALGRLEIPEAGVSVMLLEGTDEATLDRAVGHIEGTALPDEPGNVGIAGHRDGYFRGLRHLERGDELRLATLEGIAHYEVESIRVVDPERVDVLGPTEQATLTLVTCYPFYHVGDAPQRYIVRARRVRQEPWSARALPDFLARR